MLIDPTTNIGKLRLRVGDYLDLPILPDTVYQSTLDDCNNNLPRSATLLAQYILASLAFSCHERLAIIEVYGSQMFDQYLRFIQATILNPNLMEIAPIPYSGSGDVVHPLIEFQKDWNLNYSSGTQSEQMKITAIGGTANGLTFGF